MANRRVSMRRIRELLRLHQECGLSRRQIGEGPEDFQAGGGSVSIEFQTIRTNLSGYDGDE